MRTLISNLIIWTLRVAFWFRYRVEVRGFEHLDRAKMKRPGGVLFLPNHPAVLVDPCLVALHASRKLPVRPIIVEYMYFLPFVHSVMKFIRALPMPDFESATNSFKRKRGELAMGELVKGLKEKENFLIYPAGRLKRSAIEQIGGASATHQILQQCPEANVILVRVKGLWGSLFSSAFEGRTPPLFPTLLKGIKILLKNGIFFAPRRRVVIEFHPAPEDFPRDASRLELNRWLEQWYNRPDGLTEQKGDLPGDSLMLVSYSFWKREIPALYKKKEGEQEGLIQGIDNDLKNKVLLKLKELSGIEVEKITPEMALSADLGLDSLDIADLATFIKEEFNTPPIPILELSTVNRALGLASKKIRIDQPIVEEKQDISGWKTTGARTKLSLPKGDTIPEVFLRCCDRMKHAPACADDRFGIVSYPKLKLVTLLFADYMRQLKGKYVGILLPASVAAYAMVFAAQLAGKVPVMINWTIGPRHLLAVRKLIKLDCVLTSWAFLEKLDSVDLTGIDDILVMLENVKKEMHLSDKIRAYFRSKRSADALLKIFNADAIQKQDEAVILFTSGTENEPKGVPLSHENLLANTRSVFEFIDIYSDDVLLGTLPPFHAFGFGTSGIMGLISGVRSAYYPNPTDGKGVAAAFAKWGATITCGAPSFIKAMLHAATPDQLKTMRIYVSGAERAPPELFSLLHPSGKEHCLIEGYGVTECSPILTANAPGKPRKGVGAPLPGIEICVVHQETYEPLPVGSEGLILARGANIFSGYLNAGAASPFLTVSGQKWYNTGDIGSIDEQKRLTISGRKKRFVKVGGEMVSLLSIETELLNAAQRYHWKLHQDGPSLAIIAKEQPGDRPEIILVAAFDLHVENANQALRDAGFGNLIKISRIVKVVEIPVMGTGKTNYRELEEKYLTKEIQ